MVFNFKKMKKLIYTLVAIIISCNSVKNSDNLAATKFFEENSKTMQTLESYANESVDYSKFQMMLFLKALYWVLPYVEIRSNKIYSQEFFAKYDVKYMAPFNFLQANSETGESDGSVRFYYDMR